MNDSTLEILNTQPRIDCNPIMCQCFGNGPRPVFEEKTTGKWFILMGHSGFNSSRNNFQGYKSEKGARASILNYQTKGMKSRGQI